MSRPLQTLWALFTSIAIVLTGCHPRQPFYLHEDGDLSHYVDVATDIEYPDVCTTTLAEVDGALPPISLNDDKSYQFKDMSLEEAVQLSLCNSKVMRTLGGRFASTAFNPRAQTGEAPEAVSSSPESIVTVYDAAISETQPFVGVESALAAFDAQLSSNLFWEKNDRPQNVRGGGVFGGFFTPIFEQDNSTFNTQISKVTAGGGTFTARNNIFYDLNNNPTRQIPSDYNVNFEASFAQPLLQGAGAQFNRIAGPQNPFTGVGTPAFDGVMLARINTDITLADFERGVRNLVSDVEDSYWELYFAYRALEASKTGRASALQTWKKIHALYEVGAKGGEAEKEAQAREQYFLFQGQVQTALRDLHRAEQRLRYVIGIAVSDGRLIRPCDEPTAALVRFDWLEIHSEGLCRNVELRRQKWRIKQRELELIAAKNLIQPRLDAVGRYRWLGLGDQLLETDREVETGGLEDSNAFQSLTGGDFQEWQLGLQFTMPIGFRRELSTIRHFQLQLARERARLQDQELEISHQLGDALGNIEYNYDITLTNFNRRVAAERQVEAVEAAYIAETVTLDLLLDAQRRRADAEIAYFRALVDYNRGIKQVHLRKGSLLEYCGVYLTEGPWPAKAQFDAHRLARQRDASYYLNYGFTRPRVVSEGPIEQHGGSVGHGGEETSPEEIAPGQVTPEEAPEPTPAEPQQQEPQSRLSSARRAGRAVAAKSGGPALNRPARPRAPAAGSTVTTPASDGFEWGQLGMAAPTRTTRSPADVRDAQQTSAPVPTTTGLKPVDSTVALQQTPSTAAAEPVELRLSAAENNPTATAKAAKSAAAPEDRVQAAAFSHQWKSTGAHESVADQTAGATDRPSAGWKRTKR